MYNLRTELVKSTLSSLKIDNNPFNQQIITDKIQHIRDEQLQDFYGRLFDESHRYLNGLDRVAKVAEQFKPQVQDNPNEAKAKELIQWCETANATVFDNAKKSGRTFDDEIKGTKFTMLSDTDLYVLNQIKPHSSHKLLIGNIRCFQDSQVQLQAFVDALKFAPSDAIQIANPLNKLQIKGIR